MKKFTFMVAFAASVLAVSAQNLLTNPSFETWTNGVPDSWSVVGTTAPTGYTISPETTIIQDGSNSFKVDVPTTASGTISWSQSVPVTAGKTYTLYMSYYIVSGDNTDARIWCNFKKGTTFLAEADIVATGLYPIIRGPGCANSQGTTYFPDVKGSWQLYTTDITIPATIDGFDFQFRTYKGAVVIWDNMVFGEKGTVSVKDLILSKNIYVKGGYLNVSNVSDGTSVEVFNTVGKRVQQGVINGSQFNLSKLTKGMYIVRVGNATKKITL